MSKCCCCRRGYGVSPYGVSPYGVSPYGAGVAGVGRGCGCGSTYGGCNFACFIILILILVTFGNNNRNDCCGNDGGNSGFLNNDNYGTVGKGILFVIALYYLSCWSPCATGGYGGGRGYY